MSTAILVRTYQMVKYWLIILFLLQILLDFIYSHVALRQYQKQRDQEEDRVWLVVGEREENWVQARFIFLNLVMAAIINHVLGLVGTLTYNRLIIVISTSFSLLIVVFSLLESRELVRPHLPAWIIARIILELMTIVFDLLYLIQVSLIFIEKTKRARAAKYAHIGQCRHESRI